MSILNILKGVVLLGLMSSSAMAATYSTTLDYSGLSTYTEQVGGTVFGTDISAGDTVTVTHQVAAANDYWSLSGTSLWVLINVSVSATRTGDTSLSFYNNGILVGSGSVLDAASKYVHIGQPVDGLVVGLQFDTMVFNYLLSSTTSATNMITGGRFTNFWAKNAKYNVGASAVPVPAAVWLMGSGLLGLMGFSRKNKKVAV